MKKKTIINKVFIVLLTLILVFAISSGYLTIGRGLFGINSIRINAYNKDIDNNILVIRGSENYAWSRYNYGSYISDDGTIYKFNIRGSFEEDIISHSEKTNRRVSEIDLIILKRNISRLKDNIVLLRAAYDSGANYLRVNKNGNTITIKQTGDYRGVNETIEAIIIRLIASKYI